MNKIATEATNKFFGQLWDDLIGYFKVYDFVTEKDGYNLYMKDIYFDQGRFSMKIAVEDENGNPFYIQEGDIVGNYNISTRFGAVNGENIKNVHR